MVSLETLLDEAFKMAEQIIACAPLAVSAAKESINIGTDMSVTDAIDLENRLFGNLFASADQKEGMTAFLEKRKPTFLNK